MLQNPIPAARCKNLYPWFFSFILLFLLTGIIGHDPWKQDETYSFGIIYHFYVTHSWLVPVNVDTPFMEKPPLYYWTGVLFCRMFSGWLALHDAARLASYFYMLITCVAVWNAGQIAFGKEKHPRRMGLWALSLLLGSLGLVRHAHDMFTDVALLAGTSVALWGLLMFAGSPGHFLRAGLLLGIGAGTAFLSKGLVVPALLGLSSLILLAILPQWRAGKWKSFLFAALIAGAPFVLIWPYLLYEYRPDLFTEWLWTNNLGRFLGFSVEQLGAPNQHFYMFYTILWFAFPAFPLALAFVIKERGRWREAGFIVPLVFTVVGFTVFAASASARALYLLPLLPAVALLGAQGLRFVPEKPLRSWNRLIQAIAAVAATAIITIWLCLLHPSGPQPFAFLYPYGLPLGFMPQQAEWAHGLLALLFVLMWLYSFRLKLKDAAIIWFCALALLWGTANALLLPWVDETRSFRPAIESLNDFLRHSGSRPSCIARMDLGESTAPMWDYFGGGEPGPLESFDGKTCPLLLQQSAKSAAPVTHPGWHKVWQGARVQEDKDVLQLWERDK